MNIIVKNICSNCGSLMEVRKHKTITEKILKQPYYFSEWNVCRECKRVQHFEDNKIYNISLKER